MAEYSYSAIDQNGSKVTGKIQAPSSEEAMESLANQGLIPTKVRSRNESGPGSLNKRLNLFFSRVKLPELIIFTKQFRTLFKAGLAMNKLWDVMEEQTDNPRLKEVSRKMAGDIDSGTGLSETFKKNPRIFSPLYCSMIQAGENSGRLPEVMDRLVYLLQHEHKIKSDVRKALQYPIMVLATLVLAFFFLLTFVVPQFVETFQDMGIDLPLPTRILILMHEALTVYWAVTLAFVVAVFILLRLYLKTDQGQYQKALFLIKLPILGEVYIKGAMARFASIFSIFQASGVSTLNTLSIISETIGNAAISREFDRLRNQLKEGRGIAGPLKKAKFFPPMVVNMVAIGEESGNLDEMLHEVATHYDDEVEYIVSRMSEAITPILTVVLAAAVGFFVMAIFMPMWSMVDVL